MWSWNLVFQRKATAQEPDDTMRLHLSLTPNTEPVPFNYQHQLTGALHKWLGENELHDKISLYSFSWLRGRAERVDGGLNHRHLGSGSL
jgi:CRISPR/Cas system endoribonuclease Cas6 (RAMP superfamily)